jgi:DNA-directed RNA polymerase specialized sigma24 family protein
MLPFDSLYNFARWLAGDETGAEDLVQEACTKAPRGFLCLTPGTDFRARIFRILRNAFLLAIPIGTVMSRMARLRKLLGKSCVGERPESSASAGKVN